MPEYTFRCDCGHEWNAFQHMSEAKTHLACTRCKGIGRRIFKAPRIAVFQEFVTADITGEPVRISSTRQELDICKRNGVAPATSDDLRGNRRKPKISQVPLREDYERTRYEMEAPKY